MMRIRHAARRAFPLAVLVPATALMAAAPSLASQNGGGAGSGAKPTVVLVHGAWADDSGWDEVIRSLQAKGYPVVATANPLRGLDGDSAYLAARLKTIEGPVVLAAHSYGGAVITNAAAGNPNVKSLVYIAAFAPDKGETALELAAKYPGSHLSDDPDAPFPTALAAIPLSSDPADIDTYIKPDKFGDVFLSDRLAADETAALAARQRPAHVATTTEATSAVAWKTIPSWYLVATDDRTIGTDNVRFMAERAGATTVEVDAPHAVLETDPDDVTDLILRAAHDSGPALAETGAGDRAAVLGGAAVLAVAGGTALVVRSRRG
ncbi:MULTISPECIES: alpha/beta hydrolase [Streptomyces]|uniref:Alpha/beta hydrolase n=1 Tax=Streptomyces edwardsiae TaxID=3075527 RepID=A0ABU2Q0A0_9ACTN|nr:alpha/beta hydrolase [Streptomyces sp. DSM 41636]MDT0397858.1 alpha/beta hydrolase [Streptomyces sp. DSM 41636]